MGKYSDCWTYPSEVIDEKFGHVVSKETTVNSKPLSGNITLTASDVGAVPTTRKINSKPLSSNITLTASDVGAIGTDWYEALTGNEIKLADGKKWALESVTLGGSALVGSYAGYADANSGKMTLHLAGTLGVIFYRRGTLAGAVLVTEGTDTPLFLTKTGAPDPTVTYDNTTKTAVFTNNATLALRALCIGFDSISFS